MNPGIRGWRVPPAGSPPRSQGPSRLLSLAAVLAQSGGLSLGTYALRSPLLGPRRGRCLCLTAPWASLSLT
jgi:hypothetical protein